MPYHVITARTQPERTIIFVVSLMTLSFQVLSAALNWPLGLFSLLTVAPVAIYGVWASKKNLMRHMARSSFWLGMLWVWTGLTRLITVEGIGQLLWTPFFVVGAIMGVVYLYTSYQRKVDEVVRNGDLD